ncbi:MAG: hypothetical protein U0797_20815 [Gemmataceae bacterium]
MLFRLLLTLLLVALLHAPARAQRLGDGEVAFEKKAALTNSLRKQLFRGEIRADPRDKNHVEAVEVAAKETIYPLFWRTERRPEPGAINALVERFDTALTGLSGPRGRGNTAETQQLFCQLAIQAVVEVMHHEAAKPIATVNAARILSLIPERRAPRDVLHTEKEWADEVLPRLAGGTGEQLAAACVQLVEDPKTNDGARYYLLRTLASLLGVPSQVPVVKPETAEKAYAAAVKLVEKKNPFPKATPRQEVDGYRVLRQQAVKLLAQARVPVVGKDKVALTLARVAGNDEGLAPPPRIEERIEAAIGLARMAPAAAKFPDFQIDYAASQVARAVAAFGRHANANLDSKPQMRLAPWAVEAARLLEAVEGLRHDVKSPYVQKATDQCLKLVLASIERRTPAEHAALTDWLGLNPPPATSLFKGDEGSAIKPAAEEAIKEEKEEKEK